MQFRATFSAFLLLFCGATVNVDASTRARGLVLLGPERSHLLAVEGRARTVFGREPEIVSIFCEESGCVVQAGLEMTLIANTQDLSAAPRSPERARDRFGDGALP